MLGLFTAATEKLVVQVQNTTADVRYLPTTGQDCAESCALCGVVLTLRGEAGSNPQRILKLDPRSAETSSVDTVNSRTRRRRRNQS